MKKEAESSGADEVPISSTLGIWSGIGAVSIKLCVLRLRGRISIVEGTILELGMGYLGHLFAMMTTGGFPPSLSVSFLFTNPSIWCLK